MLLLLFVKPTENVTAMLLAPVEVPHNAKQVTAHEAIITYANVTAPVEVPQ